MSTYYNYLPHAHVQATCRVVVNRRERERQRGGRKRESEREGRGGRKRERGEERERREGEGERDSIFSSCSWSEYNTVALYPSLPILYGE